jgi:integrase
MLGGGSERAHCPRCQSERVWRDGLRKNSDNVIQRFICRECGYRFSESEESLVFSSSERGNSCQVCDQLDGSKNLIVVPENGTTGEISETKSLLVQYSWNLKKRGNAETTIESRVRILRTLSKRGANLLDPESVKEAIVIQQWVEKRKAYAVDAYTLFLKMLGKTWEPPKFTEIRKLPFIPKESEIDILIAGSGYKLSTFLQLLKETAMRAGEAQRLTWNDIDFETSTIRVSPEKGSNPRIFRISNKLIGMLIEAKRKNTTTDPKRVFAKSVRSIQRIFEETRKRLSIKLQNPRLLQIHFHTLRHWKATMLYHEIKDPLRVQEFLGHTTFQHTTKYIQLERALFDESKDNFVCKTAKSVEEAIPLIEIGFEYVHEINGLHLYRKRL